MGRLHCCGSVSNVGSRSPRRGMSGNAPIASRNGASTWLCAANWRIPACGCSRGRALVKSREVSRMGTVAVPVIILLLVILWAAWFAQDDG